MNISPKTPSEDLDSIIKIARFIRASEVEDKEKHFETKYSIFKTKYPQLYKKVCNEPDFDLQNLAFMLQMLDSINTNEKAQFDAEAMVGQMLFDKYVKPNVDANKKS